MDLATAVSRFRARKGLTLEAFGLRVGLTKGAIHRIERRLSAVSVDSLGRIAREIGLTADQVGEIVLAAAVDDPAPRRTGTDG